jgi:hypothetical protein
MIFSIGVVIYCCSEQGCKFMCLEIQWAACCISLAEIKRVTNFAYC